MYNDSLLELIVTFTPSEKSNFKRYISFTGGGRTLKYEELYNIYNKHLNQGYDKVTFEKKVKAALNKKPKLNKDLNNIRKRLKDKLLESLTIQNIAKNNSVEIAKGINELLILVERKLYQAAIQKIKLLKDKAHSFNLNKYLIELVRFEISIKEKSSSKDYRTSLLNLIEEEEAYLSHYSIELNLKNIFCKINMIVEKDLQLNKEENLAYLHNQHNQLSHISINKHIDDKQVYIVLWFYRIKNLYYRIIDKIDLAYENSKKLVDFFESNKIILKNFQKEYVKAICSFSRTCFHLDKRKELDSILLRVQNVYQKQKDHDSLEATCDMGVLHYLNTFQYEKADEIAVLMDKNWQDLQRKTMDGKLLWYTHTNAIFYWIIQDQQKFELWTDRGLSIQRPYKGKMLFFGIRMLMLAFAYDNKELLYFNEKVEALKKTLSNNDDLKLFQKIVFKYLKKIATKETSIQSNKEKTTKTLFEEFKAALLNLQKGKTNFVSPINYEEILLWCESHIQKKSIKAVFEADLQYADF